MARVAALPVDQVARARRLRDRLRLLPLRRPPGGLRSRPVSAPTRRWQSRPPQTRRPSLPAKSRRSRSSSPTSVRHPVIEIWRAAFSRCSSTASTARPGCGPTSTATHSPQPTYAISRPASKLRSRSPGRPRRRPPRVRDRAEPPERNPVGAGAYTVVGQLGALRSSPPEPFNIA